MSGTPERSTRSRALRWLAAVVGCLISLTAPFDMDTVALVLEHGLAPGLAVAVLRDAQDNDPDEENLLSPTAPPVSRRDVRKQPRLSGGAVAVPESGALLPCRPRLLAPERLAIRPGGEHAFRNGCGAPLLC
jgi:hypothetical protein